MGLVEWIPGLRRNAPRRNVLILLTYLLLILAVIGVISQLFGLRS